jgi:predicted HAD superfamily Cof-like phosphohydrolase
MHKNEFLKIGFLFKMFTNFSYRCYTFLMLTSTCLMSMSTFFRKGMECVMWHVFGFRDYFNDTRKFSKLYLASMKKTANTEIDVPFITKMVNDELGELKDAKTDTEKIDALLDAVYYILQHLSTLNIDISKIWVMIHNANMRKFNGGYLGEGGKWMKPKDFVPPDAEIEKYLQSIGRGAKSE